MTYPLYIFLGVLPCIVWLLFFLRKDVHPEPNRMIIKIFLYGMLFALPAILIEWLFIEGLEKLKLPFLLGSILYWFLGVALVEEFLKYLVVKKKVLSSPELDEPSDLILYMIISALGFAALENILIFLRPEFFEKFYEPFLLSLTRFLGGTFLHALCSAILGYFLVLSFFYLKNQKKLFFLGLAIVTSLHGLYDFFIMLSGTKEDLKFIIVPGLILIFLAIFVFLSFKKIKGLSSVCKIS